MFISIFNAVLYSHIDEKLKKENTVRLDKLLAYITSYLILPNHVRSEIKKKNL